MRLARIDFPGARHHVMNRGARRQDIFLDDDLFDVFLDLVSALPVRFHVTVHGYALMPNHYHLMLESRTGQLSRAMKFVGSEFTRAVNHRMGWDGPLFRSRFKNRVVNEERWWRHLLTYLHLNPEKAGLEDGDRWRTSHSAYVGGEAPDWLETAELLNLYGGPDGYLHYLRAHGAGHSTAPEGFERVAMTDRAPTACPTPRWVSADPDVRLARALAESSEATARPITELLARGTPPRGNRAGWVAVWWADRAGVDHGRISRRFRTSQSEVSRRARRVEGRRHRDADLARWTSTLLDRSTLRP